MKRRNLILSIAAIVTVLAAVPFALAQHHRAGHGHGWMRGGGNMMMFGRMGRAKAALGLSDQQSADIQKIFTDLRTQNEPYRASMRSGMQSVAQALIANPNDVGAAQALLDKQIDAERQMKTNALNAAAKALNVLSPDQRAKAATILQQRMARQTEK
ncbi:MAG: motif family protein [Thermoanaerobaculia bacterium]|jgi:Spy/CpxP family protein refolding chaperone|nr:motif family protein [Thermoanaerobaculia bacterium]